MTKTSRILIGHKIGVTADMKPFGPTVPSDRGGSADRTPSGAKMKLAIITINKSGKKLARKLKANFSQADIFNCTMTREKSLKTLVEKIFGKYDGLIFIAALGIVVRVIQGQVKSKFSDPAIVAIDTAGRFAISLLSGHEGGANKLAFLTAASINALPIITTGTEVHKKIILGIGTRRGIDKNNVKAAIKNSLKKASIKLEEIRIAASIDLKKDESGLIKACQELELPLVFIPKEDIKNFHGTISSSKIVQKHIGLDGVCEPCALLAGRRAKLILKKQILNGVTLAISEEN